MKVIHLARKPLSESSVAANVLEHGTGALNIDATRIGTTKNVPASPARKPTQVYSGAVDGSLRKATGEESGFDPNTGRWPSNAILQHLDGCRCVGTKRVKAHKSGGQVEGGAATGVCYSKYARRSQVHHADEDGKEEVAVWECDVGCPVAVMDEAAGPRRSGAMDSMAKGGQWNVLGKMAPRRVVSAASEGFASRFFKQIGGEEA